jgi:pimeloyl-ACP methyl ester carboxylesterase
MPTAKLRNVEMYYEIHGEGDPLVLVCGLSIDHRFWQAQIRGLSQEFQVIVFDNRDTGQTTFAATEYGIDELADDLADFLQELKIEKVHLLGFSMGGFIAQSFAARYPEKLKSLILAATAAKVSNRTRRVTINWLTVCAHLSREDALKEMFLWVYSAKFYENDQNWRKLLDQFLSMPPAQTQEQFERQARSLRQHDLTHFAQQIKTPTLVLVGTEERVFTVQDCTDLANLIEGAELHVFEGLAHNFCVEDPRTVNDKIASFCHKHKIVATNRN